MGSDSLTADPKSGDIVPQAQQIEDANDLSSPSSPQEIKIKLSWRSWVVVFVSCFAIVAQVFVVTAAGSIIAFIIRDLGGDPGLAGWIIRWFPLCASLFDFIVLKHRSYAHEFS